MFILTFRGSRGKARVSKMGQWRREKGEEDRGSVTEEKAPEGEVRERSAMPCGVLV
jgi:hypothetical protein